MKRLLPTPRADLDSMQRRLYDELVSGPRGRTGDVSLVDDAGCLRGPFAVMVTSPALGDAVQRLGAALRYASDLDPVVREATVLLIAAQRGSRFEWEAHESPARRLGLDDAQLAQLRQGQVPAGLSPTAEQALVAASTLLSRGTLDDATFAATQTAIGERGLAELVWLVGYYAMLALALAAYDPDDQRPVV